MQEHLPQLAVKGAYGSKIFLENGQILIDGISSWWSVAHGYNHKHIIKEITKQAKILPHIMLAGFANEQTYKLAHRLCKFSKMDRVFFSDSGSTAVEVAMKMAWQFFINCRTPQKNKFISFKNSYHGDTSGAMSLADLNGGMHEKFKNILLQNFSLNLPQNFEELNGFENFIKTHQNEIAAIFVEPLVQCAGGMKFHDPKILNEIFEISKKYHILFIADECAVGFYRTKNRFAYEAAKIEPDILILGKALTGGNITLAATLVKNHIYEKFLGNSLDLALMHGPTFMGNPLAAAAANASLDLFEQINYFKKVTEIEKNLTKNLAKCRTKKGVKDVRVLGAIGVVELENNSENSWAKMLELRQSFSQKHDVFLRPFANCIYLMPALNIKNKDLEMLTSAIKNELS